MAKKVNGYMVNHGGWIEFDQAPDDNGPWVPCTMVIADKAHEPVFTESEVRAMAMKAIRAIKHDMPNDASVGIAVGNIAKALSDAGIVLDPA